jgi:release factor glutamine methyltransferase
MKFSNLQRNKIIYEVEGFTKAKKYSIGNIELFLNKHTLIPHPDTLRLIKLAKAVLRKNSWINTVADVGTGSGIIAISLARKFPFRTFLASDICENTLTIARKNSVLNSVKNINFLHNTDKIWLSEYKNTKVDFIVSNPPFVGEKEFNDKKFQSSYPEISMEPSNAIVTHGDSYGLSPYLEIINNSDKTHTTCFLFQCNSENIWLLKTEIKKTIKCRIKIIKDTENLNRFLLVSKI